MFVVLLSAALSASAFDAVNVAPNVYVFLGAPGEISKENKGRIGNAGFFVGPSGVVVVDSGVSYRHAQEMVQAIQRISKKPIRAVVITHAHQEFLFGNALYQHIGAKLYAHKKTAELIRSRCENCLKLLKKIVGNAEMRGTKVIAPRRVFEDRAVFKEAGLELELIHPGWAATPGDLAVFHRASGTLFAGALVDVKRVPDLRDSRIKLWIAALPTLQALPIKVLIGAHGPVGNGDAIGEMKGYLEALLAKTKQLYDDGVGLAEVTAKGDLPDYRDWALYAEQHHRNVHRAYLQLEEEDLRN